MFTSLAYLNSHICGFYFLKKSGCFENCHIIALHFSRCIFQVSLQNFLSPSATFITLVYLLVKISYMIVDLSVSSNIHKVR
jgi:hypothetical protein